MANIIKTLATMIQKSASEVEEKQREIAKLNKIIEEMETRQTALQHNRVNGTNLAAIEEDATMMLQASNYMLKAGEELADIAKALIDAGVIVEEKNEELRELFIEKKQYEILHTRRLVEEKKKRDKKHQQTLDEIATARHIRILNE